MYSCLNSLFHLLLDETFNASSKEQSDYKAFIIAPTVGVIAILVVVFLLVFLMYRRRQNRKKIQAKLEPGTPSLSFRGLGSFPAVSVKDHINNMLTADDLLKSKMPVNDVKRIRQFPVDRVAYDKDLGEGQFGQVFQGKLSQLKMILPGQFRTD